MLCVVGQSPLLDYSIFSNWLIPTASSSCHQTNRNQASLTSSPPWKTWKEDWRGTNTQEGKLEYAIHMARRKKTKNTGETERETETKGEAESLGGQTSRFRTSGMRHWQPGERERSQDGGHQRQTEVGENSERGRREERVEKKTVAVGWKIKGGSERAEVTYTF